MHVTLSLSGKAVEEFKKYHNRATNTLEPDKWPEWVKALDAQLEADDRASGTRTTNGDFVAIVKHWGP